MTKYNKLTPEGTSDMLFEECSSEKKIIRKLETVFENDGYRQVRTPGLEFLSVFASNSEYFPQESMYKFSDSKGRMVAVRPDSTIPIARLTSTKLQGCDLPIRLYYAQNVFRTQEEHRGLSSEIMQMGVELIGERGIESDIDMIDLAIRSLSEAYSGGFRIEIGHVGLYKKLMSKLGAEEDEKENIHRYITVKNYSALEDILDRFEDKRTAELIRKLPSLFGSEKALDDAAAMFSGYDNEISEILSYVRNVFDELCRRGYEEKVMIDLGLVNQAEYYSSLVFKGYGDSAGEPLLSGGRYDELFADYGKDFPATGFAVNVDLLTDADVNCSRGDCKCGEPQSDADAKPLRIALTKGRLEKDFIDTMEKAGYDVSPVREKGRKLLISIPGAGLEIFLAKAADVITYVEHGVCEIGIVGKDTIAEQGGVYYEIMDLGFGKCRFALAAPKGAEIFDSIGSKVIASKYPNFAGRYFQSKGMDVEIIKIEGSVEIAPLLNLADGIVDIVETGTTLKENGLEVIDYIRNISARLIVNVTGMKLRKKEIDEFVSKLEANL